MPVSLDSSRSLLVGGTQGLYHCPCTPTTTTKPPPRPQECVALRGGRKALTRRSASITHMWLYFHNFLALLTPLLPSFCVFHPPTVPPHTHTHTLLFYSTATLAPTHSLSSNLHLFPCLFIRTVSLNGILR